MITPAFPFLSLRRKRAFAAGFTVIAGFALDASPALAHASERGHVLLLPTGYYVLGGALAVALSFLLLLLLPPRPILRLASLRLPFARLSYAGRVPASLASFSVLVVLVCAGFAGSRDPFSNPLPLAIWTLLWVGMTMAQGLLGNIWAWLNPWYGPWRLWTLVSGRRKGFFALAPRLGLWPACALLFAFVWFELVFPAPDDPERLAIAVLGYMIFTSLGIIAFGYRVWTRQVEFLTVFFAMIAQLSLFRGRLDCEEGVRLSLGVPAGKLTSASPLMPSGMAFLLLALASVSFDGLTHTFFWLERIGVNPLEYPGRTAVMVPNTMGLAGMFLLLSGAFVVSVRLGEALVGNAQWLRAAGRLVWSIIPIALAYHFSHYLVALVVEGQYALAAFSDPFAKGWNLFGTADLPIRAGVTLGAQSAWIIWNLQAAAIIGGHVLAVAIAHLTAYRLHGKARATSLSQLPLVALMIAYTVFGLWLLSTPTAG